MVTWVIFSVIFVSALIGRRDTFALFLKTTKLRLGVTRIEMHATFLPNNFLGLRHRQKYNNADLSSSLKSAVEL